MLKKKMTSAVLPNKICQSGKRIKNWKIIKKWLALPSALLIWAVLNVNSPAQLWPPLPPRNQQAQSLSLTSQSPVLLKDVEDRILRLTNDIRRQHHLSTLNRQDSLFKVSEAYSLDMLVRHFFSHTNPEGLTATERLKGFHSGPIYAWGENIWEGSNVSTADHEDLARLIMKSWMSSPGHRENILNPAYTELGVGVAVRGREIRATQLFATLQRH
jgi:uncharacterized protein YkwD